MKKTKGFTLIELLVVIAIIGILSSVVLASLNSARDKGEDAAVKANLSNTRAQAEIVYDEADPNSYTTVCNDANISSAVTAAGGTCADGDDGWTITAPLSDGDIFCVDSTGYAGEAAAAVPVGDDLWVETSAHACQEITAS